MMRPLKMRGWDANTYLTTGDDAHDGISRDAMALVQQVSRLDGLRPLDLIDCALGLALIQRTTTVNI